MTNIEAHELGHFVTGQYYHLEPVLGEREVRYGVPCASLEAWLVCLVAGTVNEHMHFPESHLTSGCGGDATLICTALQGTNQVAYATALALLVEGSNSHLCIPKEHRELMTVAIEQARQILNKGITQ
jgi:hypothetical protein